MNFKEMQQHAGDAEQLLKALANANRLMILCTLAESEHSVGQLNDRIELSQSALSQHHRLAACFARRRLGLDRVRLGLDLGRLGHRT